MDQSPVSSGSANAFLKMLAERRLSAKRAIESPSGSRSLFSSKSGLCSPRDLIMQLEEGRQCFTPTAMSTQETSVLSPQAHLTTVSRVQEGRHSVSAPLGRSSVFFQQEDNSLCTEASELCRRSYIPNWQELDPANWGDKEAQVFQDCNRIVRSCRHSCFGNGETLSCSDLLSATDSPASILSRKRSKHCSKRATVTDMISMISEADDEEKAYAKGMNAKQTIRKTLRNVHHIMAELLEVHANRGKSPNAKTSPTSSEEMWKSNLHQSNDCASIVDRKSDTKIALAENTTRNARTSWSTKEQGDQLSNCARGSCDVPVAHAHSTHSSASLAIRSKSSSKARSERLKSLSASMQLNGFVPCESVPMSESLKLMKMYQELTAVA